MNDLDISGLRVRVQTVHHQIGMITKSVMVLIERVDIPDRPEWKCFASVPSYEYADKPYVILGHAAFNGEGYEARTAYSSLEAIQFTTEHSKPQIEERAKRAKKEQEAAQKAQMEAEKSKRYQELVEQQRKEEQDRNERSDTPMGHSRRIRDLEAKVARLERVVSEINGASFAGAS